MTARRSIVKYIPVSLLGALSLTGAFFGIAYAVLPYDHWLYSFFFERGMIQPLSVLLYFFGVWKCGTRLIQYLREKAALERVSSIVSDHPPQSDQSDIQTLADVLVSLRRSIARDRFVAVLQYMLNSSPTRPELISFLSRQSEHDEKWLATSYSLITAMIVLLPLSGLLGTVLGISDTVTQFSALVGNFEGAKGVLNHLKAPLSGLGLAFDTTVLAISLALVLHLVAAVIRKQQEQLLSRVDEQCETVWFQNLRLPGLAQHLETKLVETTQAALSHHDELLVQVKATYETLDAATQDLASKLESIVDNGRELSELVSASSELRQLRITVEEISRQARQTSRQLEVLTKIIGPDDLHIGVDEDTGAVTPASHSTLVGEIRAVKSTILQTSLSEILSRRVPPRDSGDHVSDSVSQQANQEHDNA